MFGKRWGRRGDEAGGTLEDPVLGKALEVLDPGAGDPGYWYRFHRTVMTMATAELSRRRRATERGATDVTVSDVVMSWSRAVVPAAMLAAALAGFLLLRPMDSGPVPVGLEELLVEGFDEASVVGEAIGEVDVSFATEIY